MENKQNPYSEKDYRDKNGHSFSTPLKLRLVAYFRNNYDLDIKDEEADLFLSSLAGLYGALADAARQAPKAAPRLSGDGSAPTSAPEANEAP